MWRKCLIISHWKVWTFSQKIWRLSIFFHLGDHFSLQFASFADELPKLRNLPVNGLNFHSVKRFYVKKATATETFKAKNPKRLRRKLCLKLIISLPHVSWKWFEGQRVYAFIYVRTRAAHTPCFVSMKAGERNYHSYFMVLSIWRLFRQLITNFNVNSNLSLLSCFFSEFINIYS